jgi:hypothetical protein
MASSTIDSSSLYGEETIADMGSACSKLVLTSEEQIAKLDEGNSALRRMVEMMATELKELKGVTVRKRIRFADSNDDKDKGLEGSSASAPVTSHIPSSGVYSYAGSSGGATSQMMNIGGQSYTGSSGGASRLLPPPPVNSPSSYGQLPSTANPFTLMTPISFTTPRARPSVSNVGGAVTMGSGGGPQVGTTTPLTHIPINCLNNTLGMSSGSIATPWTYGVVPAKPISEGFRQRTPGLKIPKYTYNGDIQLFLERMEIYFKSAGTSNSQKAELLLGALDDLSLNTVLKQKRVGLDIESYLALKAFLEKRFISAETGCTARLNFRVITQQPNEKPEEYYTKLIGLAKDAYPTLATETINELVLHKFCDGIADPTIRLKLLEHDPKNSDDAVSYCSKLLKLRNYAAALENNSSTIAKGTLNSAQLAESFRVAAVNANESSRSDSYRPKLYKSRFTSSGRPICNFCDEAGHIERNCWRKNDQNESNQRGRNVDTKSKSYNGGWNHDNGYKGGSRRESISDRNRDWRDSRKNCSNRISSRDQARSNRQDREARGDRNRDNYRHRTNHRHNSAERHYENRRESPNDEDIITLSPQRLLTR